MESVLPYAKRINSLKPAENIPVNTSFRHVEPRIAGGVYGFQTAAEVILFAPGSHQIQWEIEVPPEINGYELVDTCFCPSANVAAFAQSDIK